MNIDKLIAEHPILMDVSAAKPVVWINKGFVPFGTAKYDGALTMADIDDAEARLKRFTPLIMALFPETEATGGLIESPLTPIPAMAALLNDKYDANLLGRLLLKQDSHLAIAGSVKARGGIYEVLKHSEELALSSGLLTSERDDYSKLASPEARSFFSRYKMQVGSTGNLGMSIGIMSAALGYEAIVHMSMDAKQWKKDLLRSKGVTVYEYEGDYGEAVKSGRAKSDADPTSYFVDDENSKNLFLGYAVAAKRLVGQLAALNVQVDSDHPLIVYIPCGVGGAPGGIHFGLKSIFGDNAHVFYIEPTQAPCMLLGVETGLHNEIAVKDIGLTGLTHADGLAVGRPSGFVGGFMGPYLSGEFTVEDPMLYDYLRDLWGSEHIFIEPSSCAGFAGPALMGKSPEAVDYMSNAGLNEKAANTTHIVWATGGSLVPADVREQFLETRL